MKTWTAVFGSGHVTVRMEMSGPDFARATEVAEQIAERLGLSFLYLEQKYAHD